MNHRLCLRALASLVCLSILFLTACGGVTANSANNGSANSGTPAPPPGGGSGTPTSPPGGGSGGSSGGSGGGTGGSSGGSSTTPATDAQLTTEVVASNLQEPWSLAFAPDGRLFVSEAPGRLRVIANGTLVAQPVLDITSQTFGFEGGITGLDVDKNFATNGFLYIHVCNKSFHCQVLRIVVQGNTGRIDKVLLDYPVPAFDHVGGRLKVGPDNLIYVTTGEHQVAASAQDPASWGGKILRLNLDGTPAAGNPFPQNPYVYSLGSRDPQGLAFDSSGTLYETEHGPTANDEINIIRSGSNYGWPTCFGSCKNPSFIDPTVNLSPNPPSMPPSGATFYYGTAIPGWNGSMLIAVLGTDSNPQAHQIRQVIFDGPGGKTVTFQQGLFVNQFGRLRDVAVGPDGFVYFTTSNYKQGTHGAPDDDRIIRVRPK